MNRRLPPDIRAVASGVLRNIAVRTGFRGDTRWDDSESSMLDRFLGPPRRNVRVIR